MKRFWGSIKFWSYSASLPSSSPWLEIMNGNFVLSHLKPMPGPGFRNLHEADHLRKSAFFCKLRCASLSARQSWFPSELRSSNQHTLLRALLVWYPPACFPSLKETALKAALPETLRATGMFSDMLPVGLPVSWLYCGEVPILISADSPPRKDASLRVSIPGSFFPPRVRGSGSISFWICPTIGRLRKSNSIRGFERSVNDGLSRPLAVRYEDLPPVNGCLCI